MMIARFQMLVASLFALTVVTSLGFGCEDVDQEPQTSKPAAARSPIHVTDGPPEEEPEAEETLEEQTPEVDEGVELTWFKGVDNLPKAHPCHDSTPVVYAEDRLADRDGNPFEYSLSTLGELRGELGERWVHFGARTARGVRWTHDGREYLVATCSMGGTGYGGYDAEQYVETEGLDREETADAEFLIGRVGEPNNIEFGTVHWMERNEAGAWETTFEKTAWAWDDEGNDPEYVARARVIAAEDSDEDRQPEVVVVTIDHEYGWDETRKKRAICPERKLHHRCYGFVLEIIAREGNETLIDQVTLQLNGEHGLENEADRPDDMSDEAYETLRAQLDAHRDDAVAKARAILREAGKLR
ncbi:MAG: hypothetical protein ACQEVA_22795 [Myxococcota bacterium]